MASQPSGNNEELLFIETDEVYLTIKGSGSSIGHGEEKSLKVILNEAVEIDNIDRYIYFKEYNYYEVIIERKNKSDIEFYHENINIRNKITPTGRTGNLLSGNINFLGDVGYSDLYVKVNGKVHLKITLEVMPTKLDYKEDYKAILSDVNREIYNLAYGFLARTYLGSEINNRTSGSSSEFYSILNYVYIKLMKAVNLVTKYPHHELIKESKVVKYQNIKNTNMDTVKWLEKRPHLIKKTTEGYIPTEALTVTKSITYDTKENRFLKFILLRITEKIDSFIKLYTAPTLKYDKVIADELSKMKRGIISIVNTSFLRYVSQHTISGNLSLVFTMASGYRDIFKYYLMLQKGLSINNNLLSISMKDLPLLYEYWCFIKLNSLLQQKYKLISTDFMKVHREGITVNLTKGKLSTIKYENPKTKEHFEVAYNSLKTSLTVPQKPDNILSIYKEGSDKAYEFIFDAKYRIDTTNEYIRNYNGIGPKVEDINTMHRYRDAIIYSKKADDAYKNCVFGAFVLFPYKNEEEYRNQKFYKSIEEVNIGALPFLPSTTGLVEEFLNTLIKESSYSTFERALDKVGREKYFKEEYFKNRNVLVGSLRNKEQLEANLQGNFYHTPCKNINLAKHSIKYIALAQSEKSFGSDAGITYYGEIKAINTVKRCDIKELPKDSDEVYYVFEVHNWQRLEKKIAVSGFQVVRILYTSEFLLKNSSVVTELCIKSKEEYRLWQELRRINSEVTAKIDGQIGYESKINGFSINGLEITVADNRLVVEGSKDKFSIAEFNRRPRIMMQGILKLLDRIQEQ